MNEEPAPAALDGIEMLPMEGDARADDLHVARAVVAQRLAGAERNAMLAFQLHLLLQQKIHDFRVGRELEAQRPDDLLVKIVQRLLPGFSIHSSAPNAQRARIALGLVAYDSFVGDLDEGEAVRSHSVELLRNPFLCRLVRQVVVNASERDLVIGEEFFRLGAPGTG